MHRNPQLMNEDHRQGLLMAVFLGLAISLGWLFTSLYAPPGYIVRTSIALFATLCTAATICHVLDRHILPPARGQDRQPTKRA